MYVNREEYLILAAYVGALTHLLKEFTRFLRTGPVPIFDHGFRHGSTGPSHTDRVLRAPETQKLGSLEELAGHLTGFLARAGSATGHCWNRAIGVRSSSAEATSPGISAFEGGHGPGQTCPVDDPRTGTRSGEGSRFRRRG